MAKYIYLLYQKLEISIKYEAADKFFILILKVYKKKYLPLAPDKFAIRKDFRLEYSFFLCSWF